MWKGECRCLPGTRRIGVDRSSGVLTLTVIERIIVKPGFESAQMPGVIDRHVGGRQLVVGPVINITAGTQLCHGQKHRHGYRNTAAGAVDNFPL